MVKAYGTPLVNPWQVAAVKAGLVFTPQQLEEVRSRLPVYMEEVRRKMRAFQGFFMFFPWFLLFFAGLSIVFYCF